MSRLKRWESPRREGRNDKGKGGSARQRQIKKQMQALRRKLKENQENESSPGSSNPTQPISKFRSNTNRKNQPKKQEGRDWISSFF